MILFQDEAKITDEPHGECIDFGAEPVWSDRPGDPLNINHHIWVQVPNDRADQPVVERDGRLVGDLENWDHMWVEIHSIESDHELSEHPSQHRKFNQLYGKKVRVTVELIEEEES